MLPDQRLLIAGISARPELNGQLVRTVDFNAEKGRWNVRLESGEVLSLKAENLVAENGALLSRDKAFSLLSALCEGVFYGYLSNGRTLGARFGDDAARSVAADVLVGVARHASGAVMNAPLFRVGRALFQQQQQRQRPPDGASPVGDLVEQCKRAIADLGGAWAIARSTLADALTLAFWRPELPGIALSGLAFAGVAFSRRSARAAQQRQR
jgi:hypothetical protein